MSDKCRSCGAAIIWAETTNTGSRVPVDAEPVEGGNITFGHHTDVIVGAKGSGTHVLHFTTCPDAKRWRMPRQRRTP